MNRMSPLIARRPARARAIAKAMPLPQQPAASDDLRFFVMAWLGGLVFFATYLA